MFLYKSKNFMIRLSIILYLFCYLHLLQGCSNQQIYQAIQEHKKAECRMHPSSDDYEACMKQQEEPYESYERARVEEKG